MYSRNVGGGAAAGLDNHQGKYLPCSWSQHWPPGEDAGPIPRVM